MTPPFTLDPRLVRDTIPVASWPLCRVLLMNNRLWPWLILVPARADVREIHHLEPEDRAILMEEIAKAAAGLERFGKPDKLNIGALGNIVPQLHIHIIARKIGDPAWPGPVWGSGHAEAYGVGEGDQLVRDILGCFS